MIEIGRICVKLAGRDAGREAVVVDILDGNYVLVDGNVRRRKCNILHLEPTSQKIEINKGASHEDVKMAFSKLKLPVWETKAKEKREKPVKQRGKKAEAAEDVRKDKKVEKAKEEKKKEPVKEVKKAEEIKPAVKKEKKIVKEKQPIDARIISVRKGEESIKKADRKPAKKE